MVVQPTSAIIILKCCPLNPDYQNTLRWNTAAHQYNYFYGLKKHVLNQQQYTRYAKGVLAVEVSADDLTDCNYLMFSNTPGTYNYYYAFITEVEYVNPKTSRIKYEIDVMQTWYWSYVPARCFVERQHTETDNIGDNLVHEEINFGQYVYEWGAEPKTAGGYTMEDLSFVVVYSPGLFDLPGAIGALEPAVRPPGVYSGVYQGVAFIALPIDADNVALFNNFMTLTDLMTSGGVISCFVMPTMFVPGVKSQYIEVIDSVNTCVPMSIKRNTAFGEYTPKNNKLFTYPYTSAYLTSHRGKGNTFMFERYMDNNPDGGDGVATFFVECNFCASPSIIAYPTMYNGFPAHLEGAVTIPSLPICTWGQSGVAEWINNNLFKTAITAGATAALVTYPPAAALVPAVSAASDSYMVGYEEVEVSTATVGNIVKNAAGSPAAILGAIGFAHSFADPSTVHGGAQGDVLFGSEKGKAIFAYVQRITEEYAKIVDDYFNMFGYAVNRVQQPKTGVRPHWTYVKTRGCRISHTGSGFGAVPAAVNRQICSIYDRGITFWKNPDEIGNYTLDNSPT